ncbi:ABC transporter ATP-binding protein [Demequina silvatica]|uniref:ABC transporter ATP-binding protein n=1 Tax=Demequina silvatica TaxID=1638988 RepID=UPI0009E1BF0E|nr:ABC transporter ATP-binding protein [Demequina silvatica]
MSDNMTATPRAHSPKDAENPTPTLTVRNLKVTFRTQAGEVTGVRDASFDLMPGRTLAVVGESGSGKSTMAGAINRLLASNATIASGEILFGGRDLTTLTDREMRAVRGAGIGLVPQDPMSNLDPTQRIGRQITEVLKVHNLASGRAADARAVELLEMVGIPEPARRFRQYPHELSGGMRQRVLIAMGLACEPRLLIADEPTSALDVTVQRQVLDQMADLTARMGTAVILITHDLGLAAERADDVLVMFRGDIVEHGPAADILRNPEHEYTRRLLDAAPSITSHRPVRRAHDADAPALVEIIDLAKEYTVRDSAWGRKRAFRAVDGSTFKIRRGQTVAIVGESGSGKSTTARMVLGLERPTSGVIAYDGRNTAGFTAQRRFEFTRKVQPVFQNPFASLDSRYTIGATIAEPLVVHGVGTKDDQERRVKQLAEQVALPVELLDRHPHELSGGQRQRVAIARALALRPELVVLDEAVSALDVLVQAQILELLARLQDELDLSYLFISHDLAVIRQVSDYVHVMQNGVIVESGTPEEIFDSPKHEYTRQLLAAIPAVSV